MKVKDLFPALLVSLLCLLAIVMVFTISQYISADTAIGFLEFKQNVVGNQVWRSLFYIHVFSCFLCMFAGLTQFSSRILEQQPLMHKRFGRFYFYNILFINFPAGLFLAVHANGGLAGKLAFISLAILWFYFTVSGVYWIKQGDRARHQKHMIRSYALTLSAITLRLMKLIMVNLSDWSDNQIYVFDAWTALLLNLLIAELIIRSLDYREI